jgi:hypothetical protein
MKRLPEEGIFLLDRTSGGALVKGYTWLHNLWRMREAPRLFPFQVLPDIT